jgi:hypothetical protein
MHERTFLSEAIERLIALVDDIEGFIANHPNSPLPELARAVNAALDAAIDARDVLITHEVACEPKSAQREFTNAGDLIAYLETLA